MAGDVFTSSYSRRWVLGITGILALSSLALLTPHVWRWAAESYYLRQLAAIGIETRLAAIEKLSELGSVRAIEPVIEWMGSDRKKIDPWAHFAWCGTGYDEHQASWWYRCDAFVVGTGTKAIPALVRKLRSPVEWERHWSAHFLGSLDLWAESAAIELTLLLGETDERVRSTVAKSIGMCGWMSPRCLERLQEMLGDEGEPIETRLASAEALRCCVDRAIWMKGQVSQAEESESKRQKLVDRTGRTPGALSCAADRVVPAAHTILISLTWSSKAELRARGLEGSSWPKK